MFQRQAVERTVSRFHPSGEQPAILFCGKHRVNFAMFDPVYQLLRQEPNIRLRISSGRYRHRPILGWGAPRDPAMRNERLFAEFDVDPQHFCKTSYQDLKNRYDVFVTSNQDFKMKPRDCGVTVQIFHGVSFRNLAVNPKYLKFDKLFFPGRYMMEQYLERGYLKEGDPRIEVMGMPKLDHLTDGTISKEEVLAAYGLDPRRPTVLWCPTGVRRNSFEKYGHEVTRVVEECGCNLILKLHDHPHPPKGVTEKQFLEHARAGLGPTARFAEHSDVTPLLVAADLLISDASSVAYEYCILDRPIVFLDVPELLDKRAAMEGCQMDVNSHGRNMGRIIGNSEQLREAIGDALDDPMQFSAERRGVAEHIFHQPGSAGRRMADRLCELAGATRSR